MNADRVDDAIDRAVREMLDVEPPADLRARVMAQVSAPGSRLPAAGWILAPLAAAVLVLLAVFVARRGEPVPQTTVAHGPDVRLAPPAASPLTPSAPSVRPPAATRASGGSRRAGNARIVVATVVDDGPTEIAPLKTIAPIAAAPIEQERIAPAEIAVRPLNTITEIQIAPLSPPDRRH